MSAMDKDWDEVLEIIFEIATKILVEVSHHGNPDEYAKESFDDGYRERA